MESSLDRLLDDPSTYLATQVVIEAFKTFYRSHRIKVTAPEVISTIPMETPVRQLTNHPITIERVELTIHARVVTSSNRTTTSPVTTTHATAKLSAKRCTAATLESQ